MSEERTLVSIIENEQFVEKMKAVSNADQFVSVLGEFGIELEEGLSKEEAYDQFLKGQRNDEELSDEDLEDVSGGFAITAMLVGTWLLKGALVVCSAQAIYFTGKLYGQWARRSISR